MMALWTAWHFHCNAYPFHLWSWICIGINMGVFFCNLFHTFTTKWMYLSSTLMRKWPVLHRTLLAAPSTHNIYHSPSHCISRHRVWLRLTYHSHSRCVCVCVCVCARACTRALSHISRVQLFAVQWTIACQAPLSVGFSRQEYWSGLLCPLGDLPNPGIQPGSVISPALAGHLELPGKPLIPDISPKCPKSIRITPFSSPQ